MCGFSPDSPPPSVHFWMVVLDLDLESIGVLPKGNIIPKPIIADYTTGSAFTGLNLFLHRILCGIVHISIDKHLAGKTFN